MGNCSSNLEHRDTKRVLHVFYNNTEQQVAFYEGTASNDLEALIKKCFRLPLDIAVEFCDENGIPLALSGTMPNRAKIFMKRDTSQRKTRKIKRNQPSNDRYRMKNERKEHKQTKPKVTVKPIQSTPFVTQNMTRWDDEKNNYGIVQRNIWKTDRNHSSTEFNCVTAGGIHRIGGVYKYTVTQRGDKIDFMYVYHCIGMLFSDEIGTLSSSCAMSYVPNLRFAYDMNRRVATMEVIVDVRHYSEVNYAHHQKGIYFILKPENRCLYFTTLYGKEPTKDTPLLFAVGTKHHCDVELNLKVMKPRRGEIIQSRLIENFPQKKHEHQGIFVWKKGSGSLEEYNTMIDAYRNK